MIFFSEANFRITCRTALCQLAVPVNLDIYMSQNMGMLQHPVLDEKQKKKSLTGVSQEMYISLLVGDTPNILYSSSDHY